MLEITDIKVRSFDLDYLEVSWALKDTSEQVLDFTFQILRSEGPAGPFYPITATFENLFTFRDIEANQLSKYRNWYYKIRVTRKSDSVVQDYPTTINGVMLSAEPDLEAIEISNRMKLLLKEYTGRKVWIFPIMTFGQRCSCFDPATSRRTRSQCFTCFDVGYIGGYHAPIETFVQIDTAGRAIQMQQVGEMQTVNTTARLSNFPLLKPRDILVEAENVRWRVLNVNVTKKLRSVVHQEVTIHQIPKTDIEYRLPINVDIATLQPSPPRQFTNPHKL